MKKKLETRDMLFLLYFRKSQEEQGRLPREKARSRNLLPHQIPKKKRGARTIRKKKGVQTMAMIFQPKKEVLTDSTPFCFTKHTRRKKHAASVPCNIFIHL